MKLHIEHTTLFNYTAPVREQTGEARLQPRADAAQVLDSFRLTLDPSTPVDIIADRFGNVVHCYSVLPWHSTLKVTGTSVVVPSPNPLISDGPLSLLQRHDFLAVSRYVPHTFELAHFARTHAQGDDAASAARSLMAALYTTCDYVPGSTDITTTADAVLAGRRGVCQDFAHLLIALCRCLSIPARYVSGYLYDPTKPPDSVVASHAWAEVYLDNQGWLALDPTHNRATNERYVRVALGRDYADATPVRGVFKGAAKESLKVEVRIRPVEERLAIP